MAKKEEAAEQLSPQEQKLKALQAAMSQIEKDFGKGSIMRMGEEKIENVEVIPTGSIGLNAASQRPRRQVASPPSSMPSTPSTASMQSIWASTSTISISRSLTTESRPWRLQTS